MLADVPLTAEDLYSYDLGHHRLLEFDEEREILARAKCGDKEALDQIIRLNQRLVAKIARGFWNSYRSSDIDVMDLIQEGNRGLMRAVKKFDLKNENKFATYATWWITSFISRHCMKHGHSYNLSYGDAEKLQRIKKKWAEFRKTNIRKPTVDELAEMCSYDPGDVKYLLSISKSISLDQPVTEDSDTPIGAFIAGTSRTDVESQVETDYSFGQILELLNRLPKTTKQVLILSFGLDHKGERSLKEISSELGIPMRTVRRHRSAGLEHLRRMARYSGISS